MLSDEEKKAIEYWKTHMEILHWNTQLASEYYMKILLELIEKQSKEIEHQIEKRANQKKELAILNAKQIKFNKLVNTVNSYKGQFKRQQKEIEELKEKIKTFKIEDENIYLQFGEIIEKIRWKDKIKAKIEEVNKEMLNEENSLELFYRKKYCKEVLQSLLEKE